MKRMSLCSVPLLSLLVIVSMAFPGCAQPPAADDEAARKAGVTIMELIKKAGEERDAEKLIALCLNSPEFAFFGDGKGYSFDEFVKTERQEFPSWKSIQIRWDTVTVKVLAPDVVASYAYFHQVLTAKDGVEIALKGDVTWISVRRGGEWKLLYGHAWHFQDEAAKER